MNRSPTLRGSIVLAGLVAAVGGAQSVHAQTTLYNFYGDSASDAFGASVSDVGDIDGDCHGDVIVGAIGGDYARVLSGANGSVLYTFTGARGGLFGWSVSDAGDVNGDGIPDVVVGAYFGSYARVFSGADGSTLHTFNGDYGFGYSVAGAGDVDGDGNGDLIVGAIHDDNNGTESGSARVFSGASGAILYTFNGDSAGDFLGYSVSGAGDVDGDGFDDLFVGIFADDNNGFDSGSARVFSGASGSVLYTFDGDAALAHLGSAVSNVGDLDGDGVEDLLAGSMGDDTNGPNSGAARVYSGIDGATLFTFYGDAAGDLFGRAVSGAGDVDGDGIPDLIVGAPFSSNAGAQDGLARVFSGVDGSILATLVGDSANDWFGYSVSGAGDVNLDRRDDVIVGAVLDVNKGNASGSARVVSLPGAGIPGGALPTCAISVPSP